MHQPSCRSENALPRTPSRRRFLAAGAALAGAAAFAGAEPSATRPADTRPAEHGRRIRLGIVGCGGRGSWIAGLFSRHGGYEIHAVADYFHEVADACGDALGVSRNRRFSGLSGYRRVIDSGVEAVALETPPCFFPEHAAAAVQAGLHVYMAKPVAVDVPGALRILEVGQQAGRQKRCFFVDYQMPTDPLNIEVVRRLQAGAVGPLAHASSFGYATGFPDPPRTATIADRLRKLIWVNDVAIGGDYIVNFDIHAIDAALWAIGRMPTAATGRSRIVRADPHGDSRDVCHVLYEFDDGLVLSHHGQALPNSPDEGLGCKFYGQAGMAVINYWGKACVSGGSEPFAGGTVENLYQAGAERNIAAFHRQIVQGRFENETLQRSVDGVLACILGREAAARGTRLTMKALLEENRRLEVDLSGLQA